MSERTSGVWTHPSSFDDDYISLGESASSPQVAMSSSGDAIITWHSNDLFLSERVSGVWTHPSSLADDHISVDGGSTAYHQVVMNSSGDAVVVWGQYDGSNSQIFMSERSSGAWTHPSSLADDHISLDGQEAFDPQLATSSNGDVLVVWQQSDGSHDQIFLSERVSGVWSHPSSLTDDHISLDGQGASNPLVSMNSSGDAIIVWLQRDFSRNQLYMSERVSGMWTHPSSLTDDHISFDNATTRTPQLAMNSSGDAIIVWGEAFGVGEGIFLSERVSGVWTHPSSIDDDHISLPGGDPPENPQVTMNDSGDAIIVWLQEDGSNDQVFLSERVSGAWTHPSSLADDHISADEQKAFSPQVIMDDNGDAFVAWTDSRARLYGYSRTSGSWDATASRLGNLEPAYAWSLRDFLASDYLDPWIVYAGPSDAGLLESGVRVMYRE